MADAISRFPIGHKLPRAAAVARAAIVRRRWVVLAGLGSGQAVAFASSFYLLGTLADPIAASLGMSEVWLFGGMTGAFLLSAALSPWGGRWIDARGGRQVLVASNIAFALSLGALGIAPSGLAAAGAVVTLGFGMAIGLYGTPFAILVRLYGDKAGPAITTVSLLGAAGGAVGWPLTDAAIEAVGWRGACLSWAGVHIFVCAPLGWAFLPRDDRQLLESSEALVPVAWDSAMIRLAVIFAGAWTLSTAMSTHMPRLLQGLGVHGDTAVAMAAFMGASAIAVRLTFLAAQARVSPIGATRIGTLCLPLGVVTVLLAGPLFAVALPIGQGAGNGLLSVASGVLPLVVFGPQGYAYRSALVLTPARFLQAAGPLVFGLALQQSANAALALSIAICLVMFAATFGLRDRSAAASAVTPERPVDQR